MLQDQTIKPVAGRRYLLRTHLPLFLAADGEVLRERGMWHDLGEFVTAVVVVGSRRLAGKRSGQIACRASRRHVQPCPGELETELALGTRHSAVAVSGVRRRWGNLRVGRDEVGSIEAGGAAESRAGEQEAIDAVKCR